MSKGRTKYGISDMDSIRRSLGLSKPKAKERKFDEDKRRAQRAKFCKCPACKGYMTYVRGTNSLICENEVTKTKERTNKEGVKSKFEVTEPCGFVNLVSEDYQGYLQYLFEGVPNDIAVTENKNRKKED